MTELGDIQRYQDNLRAELDDAALYAALAAAESDPIRKDLFLQLSQAEAEHAKVWRQKLAAAGIPDVRHVPSLRTRVLARLARKFGPRFVLPIVADAELSDRDKYARQTDARGLSSDERAHAAIVQATLGSTRAGGVAGVDIARAEPQHRGISGNELRAAVLGANDGLVSNFCLVMGVAGAGAGNKMILLTGLAGLIAGASAMALGEWLSVTNARELARTQIGREWEETEQTPGAQQKELALIFQAKGLDRVEAQRVAAMTTGDKRAALDTLVREELGVDPARLGGDPWQAAGFSFSLFAIGAIFPVLPFLWTKGILAVGFSMGLSALALASIGVVTSFFSGRTPWFSAARQVMIGCVAAAITYCIGALLNVLLS